MFAVVDGVLLAPAYRDPDARRRGRDRQDRRAGNLGYSTFLDVRAVAVVRRALRREPVHATLLDPSRRRA
jgi:hypothetical protein